MEGSLLLFGGSSDERLVSVASAQNLARETRFSDLWFLHPQGAIARVTQTELTNHARAFEIPFEPGEQPFAASIREAVPAFKGKTVFIGLHGTEGEDGTIQRLLESARVPFTGSDSRASRVCFDKIQAKKVVSAVKLAVAPEIALRKETEEAVLRQLTVFFQEHRGIVVKPVASGSSFGLHIIETEAALQAAARDVAQSRYPAFMAEKMLQGRELTVGVIEYKGKLVALPPSEVILQKGAAFDYNGKYLGLGSQEITPAKLTESETASAQKLALEAHRALGCAGYTRTDMILAESGPVFLETNTLPGMTSASFIPQQLAVAGIPLRDFIAGQLELARLKLVPLPAPV